MLVGYARVSTTEHNLDLQLDALKKAGCAEGYIFTDKITGTREERSGHRSIPVHTRISWVSYAPN
jgi:DNA invertase Pin-like site-specific DNA recombinase